MKHFGAVVGAVMFGLLVGCGPVGPEELSGEASSPEAVETSRFTPEQVQEMLSKVPVADEGMVQAFADACQPTTTNSCVNAGYGSCSAWSAYSICGELSACNYSGCRVRVCEFGVCYFEARGSQTQGRNRYRVCFNAAQQGCTEYEYTSSLVCGCNEF